MAWSNVLYNQLSSPFFNIYTFTKETARLYLGYIGGNIMENILVVIRDEIRENRKVLEEIRDILKHQRNYREMQKHAPTQGKTDGQTR